MERFSVTQIQQPMQLQQQQQASLPPYTSYSLKPNLKNPSFSPKQVAQLEEAEISIFDAERYFNDAPDQKESKTRNVDKHDKHDTTTTIPRFSSVSSVDGGGYGRNYRTGSFNATPTASSEASWNSQSGLLSNPPGSMAVSMRNLRGDGKKKASSGKWFFRRRCPCSGKKSVQVKEKCSDSKIAVHSHCNSNASNLGPKVKQSSKTEEIRVDKVTIEKAGRNDDERVAVLKLPVVNSKREEEVLGDGSENRRSAGDNFSAEISHRVLPSNRSFGDGGGFSFPILNPPPLPTAGKLLPGTGKTVIISTLEDPPRESLEVFQPSDDSAIQGKSLEQHHGMTSLRDDINHHRSLNFMTSPIMRKTIHSNDGDDDGDVMSDASSDLFEIESFSTQSTMYPMYRRRDSLDEMSSYEGRRFGRRSLDESTTATPSIAPTECYEPSEASIDWSVTTAEGFSAANFSVSASDCHDSQNDHSKKLVALNASRRRGNGGLLMSCICEKAVNVAPRPVKYIPEQHHQHRSCVQAPPFPVESGRIQTASRLTAMNIPITRSYSARISRALTTH